MNNSPHYLLIDAHLLGIRCQQMSIDERKTAPDNTVSWAKNINYSTGVKNLEVQSLAPFLTSIRNSVLDLQLHEFEKLAASQGIKQQTVMDAFNELQSITAMLNEFGFGKKIKPVVPVLLWDGRSAFRRELYPEYKANRKDSAIMQPLVDAYTGQICPPTYEAFHASRTALAHLANKLSIIQMRSPTAEADDIACQLTKSILKTDPDALVTLHTEDSDWQQNLTPDGRVSWWGQRGRTADNKYATVEDEEASKPWLTYANYSQWKGIETPALAMMVKVISGDAVDNIKGVPGVGAKRAQEFLERFGSMENFLEKMKTPESFQELVDWAGKTAWKKNLFLPESQESACLSKWLIDLSKAPSVHHDLWVSYQIEGLETKEGRHIKPIEQNQALEWFYQHDPQVQTEMANGVKGVMDTKRFTHLCQALDCIPWYLAPEVDPERAKQDWLAPLEVSSCIRNVMHASRGLSNALEHLQKNNYTKDQALEMARAEMQTARTLQLPALPEPEPKKVRRKKEEGESPSSDVAQETQPEVPEKKKRKKLILKPA